MTQAVVQVISGKHPDAQVRVVDLEAPIPITEAKLREWSDGFSLPTVVRNAFVPPEITSSLFLPDDYELQATMGAVGEFHGSNGSYKWSELWAEMERRGDAYGSFGKASGNWNDHTVEVIRKLKNQILGSDVFSLDEYTGHVIFGSASAMKPTTSWHNAVDANLLFQLHGTKEWYSIESLPQPFVPVGYNPTTSSVVRWGHGAEVVASGDGMAPLYDLAAHVTLGPGDLLVNPPYSWHAVKVDRFNISLSFRGDKADIISWLALRYFDGDLNHPVLYGFVNLFERYPYWEDPKGPVAKVRDLLNDALGGRFSALRAKLVRRLSGKPPDGRGYAAGGAYSERTLRRSADYAKRLAKYGGPGRE